MIKFNDVSKKFGPNPALTDITLEIPRSDFLFVVGASGAGKTTLLKLLTRELLPTTGTILVDDWNLIELPKNKLPHLRRKITTIFQDFKLLSDRTVFENVALSLEILGKKENEIKQEVEEVLKMVGLQQQSLLFPAQLAGGELQRATIARAIIGGPEVILADEPTGNLDPGTAWSIIKLLDEINKKGTTIVMATHNMDIVNSLSRRTIHLDQGRIVKDKKGKNHESS